MAESFNENKGSEWESFDEQQSEKLGEYDERIIDALFEPTQKILEELRPEIEGKTYQLVIGDDASGRLPALLIWQTLRELAEKKETLRPQVRFIAGTRHYSKEGPVGMKKKHKVLEYIQGLKKDIPDLRRVLIVTDTIASGQSLEPLAQSLREVGVEYDIATIALMNNQQGVEQKLSGRVIAGGTWRDDSVYIKYHLGGVVKDIQDLHARRNIHSKHEQRIVNATREEITHLAHQLAKEFSKKEQGEKYPDERMAA